MADKSTELAMYVVVISDRHSDDALELFFSVASALKRAEEATNEMANNYRAAPGDLERTLTDSMERSGWLYYASLEDAGSIRVETRQPKDAR